MDRGDFLGDGADAVAHGGLVHGVGNADALVGVRPVFFAVAVEEMVSGDDEHAAFFEPFVELLRGRWQAREPQPKEKRAFAGVHAPWFASGKLRTECLVRGGAGELAFFLIIRAHDIAAHREQLAGIEQGQGDLLAEAGVGEADDGVHRRDSADDFGRADDDAGAGARQADFRKAQREDAVRLPEGSGVVVEDDAGKWQAVSVVEDEWDVVLLGEVGEVGDFVVGEHIAGGVGRARGADGCGIGRDLQAVEVDFVFELVLADFLDDRRAGAKDRAIHPLAGVADVFGHERQEDVLAPSIGHAPCEQVEEQVKRRLPTAGDGDVFLAQFPAKLAVQALGDGVQKRGIALRRIVAGEGGGWQGAGIEHLAEPAFPHGIHGGDVRGLAAAEHENVFAAAGQSVAEIVHQLANSTSARKMLAKLRKFV